MTKAETPPPTPGGRSTCERQGQSQNTQETATTGQASCLEPVVIITSTARTTATTISQASTTGQVLHKYYFYSVQLLQIRGYRFHDKHEGGWNAGSPHGLHQATPLHESPRLHPAPNCRVAGNRSLAEAIDLQESTN